MNGNISSDEFAALIPELLKDKGSVEFTPGGVSMLPTISDKDRVTLVPADRISKYDIVLYVRKNGHVVLHRTLGKDKSGGYIMCGDAQWQLERGICKDSIIAVVSSIHKNGVSYPSRSFGFICNALVITGFNGCRRFVHRAVGWLKRKIK